MNAATCTDLEKRMLKSNRFKSILRTVGLGALIGIAVALIGFTSYVFAVSPASIRNPELEHLHFRMQIVVNGESVVFARDEFQQDYVKNQCSADLTDEPIHFHDSLEQFTHIHWANMTGGMVLKNYGWNYIGGEDRLLGYTLNELPSIQPVTIHGKVLPEFTDDVKLYVYTGDESGYALRNLDGWLNKDLESFFGTESNFPTSVASSETETQDEALVRINNLIGNVVIFAQDSEPTEAQVVERFSALVPLSDSTCGG